MAYILFRRGPPSDGQNRVEVVIMHCEAFSLNPLRLSTRQVEETADVSSGGVFLPESAKERPMAGSVVRTGPGRMEEDGVTRKAPCVAAGDRVGHSLFLVPPCMSSYLFVPGGLPFYCRHHAYRFISFHINAACTRVP
jgi:co-chaperonin GroES (HSP10)